MQPFRIRTDAREWFKDLRQKDGGLRIDFDSYYFCFVAGVAAKAHKDDVPQAQTAELVEYFPGEFKTRGRLLVALFLSSELKRLGVRMDDKRLVHTAVSRLVDPESANHLTDEGVSKFNGYAHGGFDVLQGDWFDDRPRTLEAFVRTYKRRLDETLTQASY